METDQISFSLNLEDIKSIPFHKYDKNFTLFVNGKPYKLNRILADILSPKIRNLHFIEVNSDEYYINTIYSTDNEEEIDYFQEFLNLTTFSTVELDFKRQKIYSEYFYQLGNVDEYYRILPDYVKGLTIENAIDRLLSIIECTTIQKQEPNQELNAKSDIVKFIANNFEKVDKQRLKLLDQSTLEEIICCESLQLYEEDSLLDFVMSLYEDDHLNSIFFEYVQFLNVGNESFEYFVQNFNIELINSSIWRSICSRFNQNDSNYDENRYLSKVIEIQYNKGKEFFGLMRYLTNKTGGNINDNGTIEITSNSFFNHPKNLVDYQKQNWFESKDEGGTTITFDFKENSIQLYGYSIKSASEGQNGRHLKNWTIEVSNDNENWNVIDYHENDSTLNGSGIVATFNIEKKANQFYRFVRLHQIGNSWNQYGNHNRFYFYFIEFYGKTKESTKYK